MIVRPARPSDIPAMSAIRLAVTENRLSDPARITEAMYRDHIEGRGRSWVAEADGAMCGFSSADGEAGSIWALFVDPASEGLGAGKALLAAAVAWLFQNGHDEITLGTAPETRADRFYSAQGWVRGSVVDGEIQYRLLKAASGPG